MAGAAGGDFLNNYWYNLSMSSTTEQPKISILTEAKLSTNPGRRLVTIKKKTRKYFDEKWLKILRESEILESYRLTESADETEIEFTFLIEE
jgi:hypothetical protein